jgi:long-chain acyl-CoA synthetase
MTKTFGPYVWETYGQIQERRKNFGIGIFTTNTESMVDSMVLVFGAKTVPSGRLLTWDACPKLYTLSLYTTL